jgi:cysteine desulfurase
MRYGWLLLILLWINSFAVHAQSNSGPVRVELEARAQVFNLVPCNDKGIMVFYETINQPDQQNKTWFFILHNTALETIWTREISINVDFVFQSSFIDNENLFLVFQKSTKAKTDSHFFQLLNLNLQNGESVTYSIPMPANSDIVTFEIFSNHLILGLNHGKERATLLIKDLSTGDESTVKFNDQSTFIKDLKIDANTLLSELKGIAASAGAACHADQIDVSKVLTAMRVPVDFAMGTIRFSTGKNSTIEDMEKAAELIIAAVKRLSPDEVIQDKTKMETNEIKLTDFTHGLGCACKIRPQYLEQILKDLPLSIDENVIVGTGTSDDAAVYRINKSTAIVQTVDFFTPIVDDPYYFGAIAAANSLSDIYAMGAKPLFALNIVGFPDNRLPIYVLKEILKGASDKAAEAGISILGGHTVEDIEPKFGMAITGMVHPDKVLTNATAKPGDVLILTKPIGTGIISTAVKRGIVKKNISLIARNVMLELNADAANLMSLFPVNACTDITGFGLLGHLKEMMEASGVGSIIYSSKVPIIEGVYELATAGAIPGGTRNNLDYVSANVKWDENIPEITKLILCDAQTSGGLLIAIPEAFGAGFIRKLNENHNKQAEIIGKIIETDETSTGIIQVINLK